MTHSQNRLGRTAPCAERPLPLVHKSTRPCENSAAHQAQPEFRGLWPSRAEKIAKIRSPGDHTEHRIEFSHGLQQLWNKPSPLVKLGFFVPKFCSRMEAGFGRRNQTAFVV